MFKTIIKFLKKDWTRSVFIVIVLFLLITMLCDRCEHRKEVRDLQGRLMVADSLYQEKDGLYHKYFTRYQKLKMDEGVQKSIKNKGMKIRNYTRISGSFDDVYMKGQGKLGDELIFIDGIHKESKVAVKGFISIVDYFYELNISRPDLILDVVMSESRSGKWLVSVNSNDPFFKVNDIQSQISPYRRNFHVNVGVGFVPHIGTVTELGIGFKGYGISALMVSDRLGVVVRKIFTF